MTRAHVPASTRPLRSGELFDTLAGPDGQGWQLRQGCLRLDPLDDTSPPTLLAWPGDLLGVEVTLVGRCPYRVRALRPSLLQALPVPADNAELQSRWQSVTRQQWRRAVEMAQLRTGSVPERVKRLLLLLDTDAGDEGLALPRLRDLAAIVDSTPESVSRVIANLRRFQLLATDECRRHRPSRALAGAPLPGGLTSSRRLGLQATAVDSHQA